MNCLEKNSKLLNEKYPELAVMMQNSELDTDNTLELLVAKNGQPTLKAIFNDKNIHLHSAYDPTKEASKLVEEKTFSDNDVVFLFGLGLGYQLQEIIRKAADKNIHIIVIEKSPQIFRMAMENNDLSEVLNYSMLDIFVGLTEQEIFKNLVAKLRIISTKQILFIEFQPAMQLSKTYYTEVLKKIRDVVSIKMTNIATVIQFKGDWLRNSLMNLPTAFKSPGVVTLMNKFSNVPAIVVSAGPSLDKNIKELHKAKGKAIIIAVGTSMKSLLKENIIPDMVLAYDASELNYQHFKGIEYTNVPLIFDPMVYPDIVDHHKGMKFVFTTRQTELNKHLEEIDSKGYLGSGGSIATAAFSLALGMGCEPIVLIGQDLAYSEGKTHTAASIFGQNRAVVSDKLHYYEVPGYYDAPVLTHRTFDSFRKWFEITFEKISDKLIINSTEGGARIKGTVQLPLKETIIQYCQKEVDVAAGLRICQEQYKRGDINVVREKLIEIIDKLKVLSGDAKKIEEVCISLEKLYKKRLNNWKKVRKFMKQIDSLEEAINANSAKELLVMLLQDILLASEQNQLVKEYEGDDDFTRAEKRTKVLRLYYEAIKKYSIEIIPWFENTVVAMEE